nr:uncharacterized protein LOC111424224 [Onthophagus taurus]
MEYFLILYGMFLFGSVFETTNAADCLIDRKKIDKFFPLLLLPTYQNFPHLFDATYLPVRGSQNIVIGDGKNIAVACPGAEVILGKAQTNVELKPCTCKNKKFQCDTTLYAPLDVKCSDIPKPVVNKIPNTDNFKIGFKIGTTFLTQITGIYDTANDITRHTNHFILNIINDIKIPDSRPSFIEPTFPKCGDVYTQENQKKAITGLFTGDEKKEVEGYFVKGQKYLAKGHLTPNVDYDFLYQRKATFFYINAVPQWQQINNGNWKALEGDVRDMAAQSSNFLNIYTGAVGISEFFQKQLFLCNKQLPVPKFVYKVVVLPGNAPKAVAFVMSNNPYDKTESSSFKCTDVCNSVGHFINTEHTKCNKSYEKGCLYCCQVDDVLRKSIPFLPVTGNMPLLTKI